MNTERWNRASDIYSHPPKGNLPARKGKLPIGRTQFYELLKSGKFPKNDSKIGSVKMWSDSIIRSTVHNTEEGGTQL